MTHVFQMRHTSRRDACMCAARTASYAQVTEKLYDSSVYRYRQYRKHLDEAVAILKPSLDRLGYPPD